LDLLYKRSKGWTGKPIREIWSAVTEFPRVEYAVRTDDGKFWRWGLRYAKNDIVAFILLPEPGSDESVSVFIEGGIEDEAAADILEEPLTKLSKEFRKELRKYHRNK